MNTRTLVLSLAAAGALLGAGAAEARVAWSIGIGVPGVATVFSNAPVYEAPPVVYAPVPPIVRYAPPPPAYAPVPAAYCPPVPIYRPAPIVVYPGFYRHGGYHERGWRWDGRR